MTLQNAFGNLALDDTLTDGTQVTQVTGTVPLPTGAATGSKQDTGNTSLSSIDGKTPALVSGRVPIDGSGVTQPVSGTVSVSGTVPVSGPLTDGQLRASAVPVSASSLPLPSGAATSAKQPALGTAGTASSDVLTVQGIASMTALKVDGSATTQPVSGTITANAGTGTFAVSAASLPLPSDAATATKQSDGSQKSQIVDGSGNVIGATSNALDINIKSGNPTSITANAGTNLNTSALALESGGNLAAIKAKTDNIPTSPATDRATAAAPFSARLSDGSAFYDAAKATQLPSALVSGRLDVNIGASATLTTTAAAAGDVAHDAVDSGNPIKVGGKATTALQSVTTVADADRTHFHAGVDGVQIVREHSNLESMASGSMSNTDGASTSMTGFAAAGVGVKWYVTDVIMSNSSSTNITVDLRDGTAGSVKATFPVPAGGGVVHRFAVPIAFTANTAVAIDASAATTTLNVTLCGFKSKV